MDFNIFTTPLLGLVAGFLAGKLMPGEEPGGIWGTLGFGIVGSFIGKFAFGAIGLYQDSTIMGIIASIAGACLVIFVWKKFIAPMMSGGNDGPAA
jgi:uncharacterized membrane protein YeaQ/YmgE (transglycosylase-associated protein family)